MPQNVAKGQVHALVGPPDAGVSKGNVHVLVGPNQSGLSKGNVHILVGQARDVEAEADLALGVSITRARATVGGNIHGDASLALGIRFTRIVSVVEYVTPPETNDIIACQSPTYVDKEPCNE